MKTIVRVFTLALFAVCMSTQADVYSNVYFWSRGLATDLNGDGLLDAAEGRDSLNRTTFSYTVRNAPLPITNAWAHLPYRGTTNFVQAVYLPQTVVVTNSETGAGYGYPCTFDIPNSLVGAIPNQEQGKASYTIYMRFRPDADQVHPLYSWLAHFGHGSKRGIMLGFDQVRNDEHVWGGTHYYTNRTARLLIYLGGYSWPPESNNARVNLENWNDLVISVDGQKVRAFLSRDGYVKGFDNNYDNSSCGGWHTYYGEKTMAAEYDLRPVAGAKFQVGAESPFSGSLAFVSPASSNGNNWKSFRGAVQTIALWTNALTEAEMRAAAAWPRMDKWRLGVEDGAASEFATAPAGAAVDVDGDTWALPPLAAKGDAVTVRFPLDASGDAKMNQFVRIKGAQGTDPAELKITVNGTPVEKGKFVHAGRFTRWFVPCELLRPNATNTVTVTRVDTGASPFRMDVACFGGSVQYNEENGNTHENSQEGYYQNHVFDLIGANWFDGNRAIFGGTRTDPATGSSYTNQMVRFSLPEDLRSLGHNYRLTLKSTGGHQLAIYFNGTELAKGVVGNGAAGLSYDIPGELFRETNELNVVNIATYVKGNYLGFDFMRLNVQRPPPAGTMLILR